MGLGLGILTVLFICALSFLLTSGLVWVVCWAFGFVFTWKIAIGIWVVLLILQSVFKSNSK